MSPRKAPSPHEPGPLPPMWPSGAGTRPLRDRIRAGEPLLGLFCAIPHPVAVEIAGASGRDFLCLDAEHGLIGRAAYEDLIRAAECGGTPALVRIPQLGDEHVAAVLDAGAAGVLVPRVSTAAQAAAAVAAMRYPPLGHRGVGPGRATRYGRDIGAYLAQANQTLVLGIQIETAEAVAHIEAIVAVPGLDLIFVGPGDLGVSLAARGQPGAEALEAAIRRVVAVARVAGLAVGIYVGDAAEMARWRAAGVTTFILGSDTGALIGALAASGQAASLA